jgi:hypothetical protein
MSHGFGFIHCVELHCNVDTHAKQRTVALTLKDYFDGVKDCLENSLSTRVLLDLHGKVTLTLKV